MRGGDRRGSGDDVEEIPVGQFYQRLEIGKIVIAEPCYMGIREAAEKEVHLACAAMPGAKQRPPPARIEAIAGDLRSGHARGTGTWAAVCQARTDAIGAMVAIPPRVGV